MSGKNLPRISKSTVRKILPKRSTVSHKGNNGKVMVIGGSKRFYGAPVLCGLGALYSGADMVYLVVPECNFDCTRSLYPDFVVRSYEGDFLNESAMDVILETGKKCDSVVIGPGVGSEEETLDIILKILHTLTIPTVLDADAISVLKKIDKFPLTQQMVVTPHRQEFYNLIDKVVDISEDDTKSIIFLRSLSMDLHINVLLKGAEDYISSYEGELEVNVTGNAGMTVGGSGDVLAGVLASFMAQGAEGFDAARLAAFFNGMAGDFLYKRKGVYFSASDLAMALPYVLKI